MRGNVVKFYGAGQGHGRKNTPVYQKPRSRYYLTPMRQHAYRIS
jgi:hypothetical protein